MTDDYLILISATLINFFVVVVLFKIEVGGKGFYQWVSLSLSYLFLLGFSFGMANLVVFLIGEFYSEWR